MNELKIIIPMAGIGKRMGALTQHRPKALLRLADGRLLDHVLNVFKGLEPLYSLEYIFIVGYEGEQVLEHMRRAHPDKKVSYFRQEQLIGQSHAVYLARQAVSGPVFLTYCDTINEIDFSFLSDKSVDGVASVQPVADPRRHGIAVVGSGHQILRLVEKPDTIEHRLALTGVYYFSEGQALISAIETQFQRGTFLNNEYYLADAVNIMLEAGLRLQAQEVQQWHDAGTPQALIETNAYLLNRSSKSLNQSTPGPSNVLVPPLFIAPGSHVTNSIIGPNVAIGENCSINESIIANTIIDDNTTIAGASLADSVIGKGCLIHGKAFQSIVADDSRLSISAAPEESATPGPA
jgi:glucose-1-phosphate thymidylyltransferase